MNAVLRKPSLMIVEDERIVAFNLQQRLQRLGYQVTGIAASGAEALAKIGQTGPDLVLMDIRLEGEIDGIETARRLAEVNPVPVIYLTAHAEQSTMDRARATRPYGYLLKPFSELSLHATVQMALERRLVDLKLAASERRFRLALDELLEGCVIIGFDWRYIYANDSALAHFRHQRDTLLGRTLLEIHPDIDGGDFHAAMLRCMKARTQHGLQSQLTFADGTFAWFELRIHPVPEGIFALSVDITNQKLAEEKLQQLNDELEERVAARTAELAAANNDLESFSYSVSHDLRSPLSHLNGFSRLALGTRGGTEPETRRYLDKIIQATDRMAALIDSLLDLSRARRADLQAIPVDLNLLVLSVKEECMLNAGARPVDWRIGDLPAVMGDQILLRQAFINLIGNAIKFTRNCEHAVIQITAEQHCDNEAVIAIRDNGAGFDMRYADKLFGVFQRLHHERQFEGTGIGLAIVRRIFERHGGRIRAESKVGEGAVFYLTLRTAPSEK